MKEIINLIPVGEVVIVEEKLEARIITIQIRKSDIMYQVEKVTEDGISSFWVYDWQITSKHKNVRYGLNKFRIEKS